jgi:hypothetical protein
MTKTKMMGSISWLVLVLAASACGDSKKFTYDYNVNGCKTGEQTFDSKEAYCAGLKNDALNNGCAASMRQQTFQADCSS